MLSNKVLIVCCLFGCCIDITVSKYKVNNWFSVEFIKTYVRKMIEKIEII